MRRELHLSRDAATAVLQEAFRTVPYETGGVLLGTARGRHVCVAHVIGPGPDATHQLSSFAPDTPWQAEQIRQLWTQDQALTYLGDWHTHPGGTAQLSQMDVTAAASIAGYPQARQPTPVILILALTAEGRVRARAWQRLQGRMHGLRILALDG